MKPRREGAYIVRAAESRSARVETRNPPVGYVRPTPTDDDRAVARWLIAMKTVLGVHTER